MIDLNPDNKNKDPDGIRRQFNPHSDQQPRVPDKLPAGAKFEIPQSTAIPSDSAWQPD